jgi:hypothetical protein
MTSDTRTTWAKKRAQWARENSAYLNRLLSEKYPVTPPLRPQARRTPATRA